MKPDVAIAGIGMHPFGRHEESDPLDLASSAVRGALADAGVDWSDIEFACGGTGAAGQASNVLDRLSLTGTPFVNVYNGCATGGASLLTAANAIASGAHSLALVLGFDKHPRGALSRDPSFYGLGSWYAETGMMVTTQFFALKLQRYMHEHEITPSTLAKVAVKNYANGEHNEMAWRRRGFTEQEVLGSRMVSDPLTQYMFCSPGAGAVALVLCRASEATTFPRKPVYLRSAVMRSRRYGTFEVFSSSLALETTPAPSADAAAAAFSIAEVTPAEVDVAQIQDTDSGSEIMHMAECGFCEDGEQEPLLQADATSIGGSMPINTDGGCMANGEPVGASGLRQIYENVLQLRGDAGARQVTPTPKIGFTHVYGAPGVSACTVLATTA